MEQGIHATQVKQCLQVDRGQRLATLNYGLGIDRMYRFRDLTSAITEGISTILMARRMASQNEASFAQSKWSK